MVSSVQDKMQQLQIMGVIGVIPKKESKMTKTMGSNNSEIRMMGKTNQKIRRRMA